MTTSKEHQEDPELRVVTWNVWFGDYNPAARREALLKEALNARVDVLCLQEVVEGFADFVRGSKELTSRFDISPNHVGSYGLLMLVRRDLSPRFTEHELPTRMGRGLLLARLGNGMNVATVHLESLDSPRMRQRQLEEIAGVFDALDARDSILVGDFNFDSSQTWGDWNRKQRTPQGELENNVLNSVLPGWHDLWATLQPGDDGFTFDGEFNGNVHYRKERMRYDRIMLSPRSQWTPTHIALLGTEPIDESGRQPSDHYGVVATLQMDGRQAEEEGKTEGSKPTLLNKIKSTLGFGAV